MAIKWKSVGGDVAMAFWNNERADGVRPKTLTLSYTDAQDLISYAKTAGFDELNQALFTQWMDAFVRNLALGI